jgi:cysteine desulfurase
VRGALFHTDAVQGFGKVDIDARRVPFDLLSISGHKFGAPKGVGALFIRRGTPVEPLLHGGTQDRGRRPGTESVAFAVGLARASELAIAEREVEGVRLRELRDRLEALVLATIPDVVVHGSAAPRAPHIASVSIPGMDGESLLMALDLRGVACSGGSACQSGSVGGSHVLAAIGANPEVGGAAVRFSLGALSTPAAVERAAEVLSSLVSRARSMSAAS